MFAFPRWSHRAGAALAILCAQATYATPALTTIQDVIYKADGTRFNGTVYISWSNFQASDGTIIAAESLTLAVINGVLKAQLVPTTDASAGANYTALYTSAGQYQYSETWAVPPSATPLRVSDVRVGIGTVVGPPPDTQIDISDLTGLTDALNAKTSEGTAFASSHAAVIDAAGQIDAAAGNLGDCVHVDGTSGACAASPTFVDAETPAGTIDGTNTAFTLNNAPSPGTSLALYRNGVLLTQGIDYTLNSAAITFLVDATPEPGDILTASYRYGGSSGSPRAYRPAASANAPEVICGGTGASTSSTALVTLATCSIPAGTLHPGDRIAVRFDYEHDGASVPFNAQVRWGASTIFARGGTAGESFLTGQSSEGTYQNGAQWSTESWTDRAGAAFGAGNVPADAADGIEIRFQAALAQSGGDSVALRSFTVVRYPAVQPLAQ
jgi:hypothetical protein